MKDLVYILAARRRDGSAPSIVKAFGCEAEGDCGRHMAIGHIFFTQEDAEEAQVAAQAEINTPIDIFEVEVEVQPPARGDLKS